MPEQQKEQEVTKKQLQNAAYQQAINETVSGQKTRNNNNRNKNNDLVDPETIKKKLKKSLRSIEYKKVRRKDGSTQTYAIPDEKNALVNEEGFKKIWSMVDGIINNNITGGYFSAKDIHRTAKVPMKNLVKQLTIKMDKWEVDDQEDAEEIVGIVLTNVKAAMSKARHGRALQHIETSTEKRIVEKSEEQESGGFLSNIF